MSLYSDWNPYTRYVQQGLTDKPYASGAFTLIAAGPPRLNVDTSAAATGVPVFDTFFPIGMVQNFSISHNRQFNQVFELGSQRSYFVSGRTTGQLSLGRVLYHGPSLLRAMYARIQDRSPLGPSGIVPPLVGTSTDNPHNVKIAPGYNNLYMNLASDFFAQPVGLLIKMVDSNENTIGAVYAEACYVPSHSMSVESQGLLVQEQVSVQFERIVPVNISSVLPITGTFPYNQYVNSTAPNVEVGF